MTSCRFILAAGEIFVQHLDQSIFESVNIWVLLSLPGPEGRSTVLFYGPSWLSAYTPASVSVECSCMCLNMSGRTYTHAQPNASVSPRTRCLTGGLHVVHAGVRSKTSCSEARLLSMLNVSKFNIVIMIGACTWSTENKKWFYFV